MLNFMPILSLIRERSVCGRTTNDVYMPDTTRFAARLGVVGLLAYINVKIFL